MQHYANGNTGGVACKGYTRLSLEERGEISLCLSAGARLWKVAHSLGGVISTICREIASNGGRNGCRAPDLNWSAELSPAKAV